MKKLRVKLLVIFLTLAVTSLTLCEIDDTSYSYNQDTTSMHFVAYKYTEKSGVYGSFDKIEVFNNKTANSKLGALDGLEFIIYTQSINSGNEFRDTALKTLFFGNMTGGSEITGKVLGFDESSGKMVVNITMNGITKAVEMDYTLDEDLNFAAEASIDLPLWNLESPLALLGAECVYLHTGPDGVSKLWDDILISVATSLQPNKAADL